MMLFAALIACSAIHTAFSAIAVPTAAPTTAMPTMASTTTMPTMTSTTAMPTAVDTTAPTAAPTEDPNATVMPTVIPSAEPSAEPSQEPTFMPTVHPTGPSAAPTFAPTKSDLVYFDAEQTIDGISFDEYNIDNVTYSLTLKETIASLMTGVSPDDIIDLEVSAIYDDGSSEESSEEDRRLSSSSSSKFLRRLALGNMTDSIDTEYSVKVHNSNLTYSSVSSELQTGVSDGTFDENLNFFALQNGALLFVNATSTSVETENLEGGGGSKKKSDDDDGDDDLSDGAIAGIVIGVLAGFAIIGGIAYYFATKSKSAGGNMEQSLMSGNQY